MPYFICPRCTWRGSRTSRTAGFSARPAGCDKCGFGFLFELQDDYYPHRLSGIFVCDQQARVLAFGHGAQRLAAVREEHLIGQDLDAGLHLRVEDSYELPGDGTLAPHEFALEWGVRVLDVPMELQTVQDRPVAVMADFFPALDEDGGLLAVFTPRGDAERSTDP